MRGQVIRILVRTVGLVTAARVRAFGHPSLRALTPLPFRRRSLLTRDHQGMALRLLRAFTKLRRWPERTDDERRDDQPFHQSPSR